MSSKSDDKNRNPQQKAEHEAKNTLNRRNFLKIGATMSAALVAAPVITNAITVESLTGNNDTANPNNNYPIITERRTLGSGKFSMEVSAIGLGVMGMDYHRGAHPDRKANIRLLHEAVDRGVTLFDTAETYGPFVNEELAGEALSQYKDKICGFLSGSLNEYTRFEPANDNRSGLPRFQPEAIRANTRLVEVLREFGQTRGMTTAQVALAWLLTKKNWIVPIPGTTKLAHLEENIRTPQMLLTADDMRLLESEVSKITIVGDRYARTSESAKRIGH